MENLKDLRKQIDKVNQKLIRVLAERFRITQKIGEYKRKHNLPPLDKEREKQILEKNRILAEKLGLDPELVEQIFKLIFKKVRKNHKKQNNEK